MKSRKLLIGLFLLASPAFLTSCASRYPNLKIPFLGDKKAEDKKKDDGRIAILGVDNIVKVDDVAKTATIVVPAAQRQSEWPTVGGNQGNNFENLEGSGKIKVLWNRHIGSAGSTLNGIIAPPIIANGVLYTIDGGFNVRANELTSGRQIWSKHFTKAGKRSMFSKQAVAMGGGLAFENGKLFVTSGYGEILALDAKTGAQIWSLGVNAPVHSAPVVGNGKVYAVSADSMIWAINQETGASEWTESSLPETARMLTSPSATISGETIVVPFASGEIMAILTSNGRKLWSEGLTRNGSGTSLSSINDIAGRPVIHGGVVYAASQSGILAAVDLRTGVKIWDLEIPSIQTPWVAGDYVYLVSTDAKLYCIQRADGKVVWISELAEFKNEKKHKNRIVWTGPVMVGSQLILASSEGNIIQVNPLDGKVVSTIKGNGSYTISPAYKDGVLYFYSTNGSITAVQ